MKKILITASTGMLGSMLYSVLKDKYEVILVYRNKQKLEKLFRTYGMSKKIKTVKFDLLKLKLDYKNVIRKAVIGKYENDFLNKVGNVDYVINSAGIIRQSPKNNWNETIFVNSILPHVLSSLYREKLIHITTDCAFNGIEGAPYSEVSIKAPNDLYGLSKSIGEPERNSLVLRTSIIGPEISNYASLLEWVKQQEGKTINGFSNHYWNGITTRQLALVCEKVIENRNIFPKIGLFHVYSTDISKYEMIKKIIKKYNLHIKVNKTKSYPVDRRLTTIYEFCGKLQLPTFDEMLNDL
ncbi:MAG TPA: sugar nucleotide-binding protein [Patescibacteria group bacterium]